MYSYLPKSKKKAEKRICALLFGAGLLLYVPTCFPKTPYPVLFQLGTVLCCTAALMFVVRYLVRNYTYSVEPSDLNNGSYDLVVTEQYGKRLRVVCRIAVAQITALTPITPENRKAVSAMLRKKRFFTYVSELAPVGLCVLQVCTEDEICYLKINTDERLKQLLSPIL